MNKSLQAAAGGVTAALSVVLMFLGGIFWIFAYIFPMVCSLLMIIIVENINSKTAWIVYSVVSIISLLFVADKECSMMYALFFGYYPIINYKIVNKKSPVLRSLIRLIIFNVAMAVVQLLCIYVFGLPFDSDFGKWAIPIFIVTANIMFIAYDRLLKIVLILYRKKYKKKIDNIIKK